jgi:hypothetical protein
MEAETGFIAWIFMTVMSIHLPNERQDMLIASGIFAGIGAVLILLPSTAVKPTSSP